MSDNADEDRTAWEGHALAFGVTALDIDALLTTAREAGLHKWTHNARSYELQDRLMDTGLTREQLALVAAVCLSRLLPKPPEHLW